MLPPWGAQAARGLQIDSAWSVIASPADISDMARKKKRYRPHELADLFPWMPADEFRALSEDIAEHGLQEEIVLYQGKILDGRQRYRACLKARVNPRFKEWKPTNGESPFSLVVSLNLRRRMLDESQRAMVGARIATLGRGRPSRNGSTELLTQSQAAKILGVGVATIKRARQVLEQGTDDLIERVDRGELAVSLAAQIATQPRSLQRRAVKAVDESKTEKSIHSKVRRLTLDHQRKQELKQAARLEGDHNIITGDFRRIRCVADGSVDLVLTDPPYYQLELDDALGKFAARKLKERGSLIAYTYPQKLLEAADRLRKHLRYHWTLAIVSPGSQTATIARINCRLKPLLWFFRGPKPTMNAKWVLTDCLGGEREKGRHEWQQGASEIEPVIRSLTEPGDVVCDPMAGSGSTIVAALNLGRDAVGIEICSGTAALARKRIADAMK